MEKARLLEIINKFNGKHILVIGDVMLDKYLWGSANRISPEAPVLVLDAENESFAPGGAANTACNITTLGGKATITGVTGNDKNGEMLINLLEQQKINHYLIKDKRPTTTKVRIMEKKNQLLRIDYESRQYINKKIEECVVQFVKGLDYINAIIISDYAKGVVTKSLLRNIKSIRMPFFIDPKPKNKSFYKKIGATLIKPNYKEAFELAGMSVDTKRNIKDIGLKLVKEFETNLLITKEDGMSLFGLNGKVSNVYSKAKEVYDVTGAGDTVIAAFALAFTANATLEEAMYISAYAGKAKVSKIGTSPVTIEELKSSIETFL